MRVAYRPHRGQRVPVLLAMLTMAVAGFAWAQQPAVMAPLAAESLLLDGTVTGGRMVTVGERGHILLSDDGGRNWTQAPAPTRSMLTAVAFADEEVGCAVGHDEAIVCTRDGGTSWELVHWAPEQEAPLLAVLFLDRDRVFATGAYGRFLQSFDGGVSWQERWIADDDMHLNHMASSQTGRLYLAAEGGVIYRSDDEGETWEELPSPYEGSFFGTLPLSGDAVLAFGLRGNLFRSEDAGGSWTAVETETRSLLGHGMVLADGTVVVAGLAGTVLVSRDGGRTFSLRQLSDRRGVSAVLQAPDGTLVRIGEGGVRTLELHDPTLPGRAEGGFETAAEEGS